MRGVREYLAESMDMPKDVIMDLPKLSVCGDKEIYIENHKGLLEYTDQIISVKMRDGIIRLCGHKLRIIALRSRDIVVNGEFERVEYEKIGRKIKKC